jgi:hypothetical protein
LQGEGEEGVEKYTPIPTFPFQWEGVSTLE